MAALRVHEIGLDRGDPPPGHLRVHAIGLDRQPPAGIVGRLRIHEIGLSRYPDAPSLGGLFVDLTGNGWIEYELLVEGSTPGTWDRTDI